MTTPQHFLKKIEEFKTTRPNVEIIDFIFDEIDNRLLNVSMQGDNSRQSLEFVNEVLKQANAKALGGSLSLSILTVTLYMKSVLPSRKTFLQECTSLGYYTNGLE